MVNTVSLINGSRKALFIVFATALLLTVISSTARANPAQKRICHV